MDSKRTTDNGMRTARHFNFGEKLGHLMALLMPMHTCVNAAATCKFEIIGSNAWKGRESGNRPGKTGQGRTFRTSMKTLGHQPTGNFGKMTQFSQWAVSNAVAGANDILGCFDITMQEAVDRFGNVDPTEIKRIDLVDIVESLRPDLVAA